MRGDLSSLADAGLTDAASLVAGHLDPFLPNQHNAQPVIPSSSLSIRIAHQCARSAYQDVSLQSSLLSDALAQNTASNPLPLYSAYVAGVALLQAFLRDNWTGPVSDTSTPGPESDAAPLYLSLDGEDVVRSATSLYCLRAARFILVDSLPSFLSAGAQLVPWWAARALLAHQVILSNPIPTLQDDIFRMFAFFLGSHASHSRYQCTSHITSHEGSATTQSTTNGLKSITAEHDKEEDEDEEELLPAPMEDGDDDMRDEEDSYKCVLNEKENDGSLLVLAHLELALAQKLFFDSDGALSSLRYASEYSQVAIRMSGEMGVRTKHQREQKAQLVARAFQIEDPAHPLRADLSKGRLAFSFPSVPKNISESEDRATAVMFDANDLPLPQDVQLDDTDVLGYVKLSESKPFPLKSIHSENGELGDDDNEVFQVIEDSRLGDEIESLTPLEQALALAHASVIRARSASHLLTNEEMATYVDVVLRNSKSPFGSSSAVQLRALLYRVSFERNRGRYLERCMAQMDVLAKFIDCQMMESSAETRARSSAERNALLLASSMPPRWELMKELAISFGKIGLVKSAMEIFEKNEFWDELVDCHRLIGNIGKAEALVRKHLDLLDAAILEDGIIEDEEKGFNPKLQITNRAVQERAARRPRLLCVLGEVSRDPSHFETAWTESGGRYARAKRALARLCVQREEWADAIDHFRDALRVNPLFPDAWFSYGCAALKVGNTQLASNAFTTVVQQMPENPEAWNNLGRTLYDLGKKKEALNAITEAAKLHRDSWRIWGNVLTLATELRSSLDIVRGMERLLELRGKDGIVTDAIGVAVAEVARMSTSEISGEKGNAKHISKRLVKILGRCTALVSTNASVWAAYAELHELVADKESKQKAFDCRLKQVRSLIALGDWKVEKNVFRHMAIACDAMVLDAIDSFKQDNIRSARLQIDSVMEQTIETFKEDEGFARLMKSRRKFESGDGNAQM